MGKNTDGETSKAPNEIYVIINRFTGSFLTGGGSSTRPSAHVYSTRRKADRYLRRLTPLTMLDDDGYYMTISAPESYEVVKYTL